MEIETDPDILRNAGRVRPTRRLRRHDGCSNRRVMNYMLEARYSHFKMYADSLQKGRLRRRVA